MIVCYDNSFCFLFSEFVITYRRLKLSLLKYLEAYVYMKFIGTQSHTICFCRFRCLKNVVHYTNNVTNIFQFFMVFLSNGIMHVFIYSNCVDAYVTQCFLYVGALCAKCARILEFVHPCLICIYEFIGLKDVYMSSRCANSPVNLLDQYHVKLF